MFDLLSRLDKHTSELAEKLKGEHAGAEIFSVGLSLARTTTFFLISAGNAAAKGHSIKPAIESVLDSAPELVAELSTAMPNLADLLMNPETWQTSIIEIGETERWSETVRFATSAFEHLVSDCIDVLLGVETDKRWDMIAVFQTAERALDEIIQDYLLPLWSDD